MDEEAIFLEAIQKSSREAQIAFLDQACASDQSLRQHVEELLTAHEKRGQFLESPASLAPTINQPLIERLGTVIGPYKLMEQIGEGGMGLVFVAEQLEPVRRKVALKLIKPGMDTREVIARFEAERQALALMDHPHIAQVLDAGATASGRPYFVMELVKGVPITQFCDENRLSPRQRLELFVNVCQAVQHAHQKGIIHRDIKPSNVMVSSHDGRPVVKVIDFGVAKAVGQQLTDRTIYTALTQMVGTPLYMSPEQAGMSGLDVDTRTDIYSLGVLLYELLTGTTPFDKERLKNAAFDEVRRIIREEEPQKPSTRISTTDAAPSIAAQRHTVPSKLANLVRGDLDWIVMKSLEKDRTRRYETSNGLARDIQRYLADEPVEACSPSVAYRFSKFARRNRSALVSAFVLGFALISGSVISTWMAIRAMQAERLADQRLGAETKARTEAEAARRQAMANLHRAHEAVDRLLTRVGEHDLSQVPQTQQVQRKLLEDALVFNQAFLPDEANSRDLTREVAKAQMRVGVINLNMGQNKTAEQACIRGIEMLWSLSKAATQDRSLRVELVRAYNQLAFAQDRTDPTGSKSEASRRSAIALSNELIAEDASSHEFQILRAESLVNLGSTLLNLKRAEEAEDILVQALATARAIEDGYFVGKSSEQLGRLCMDSGRFEQAENHFRNAIEALRGRNAGATWVFRLSLGELRVRLRQVLEKMGRADEAAAENLQAMHVFDRLSHDYPDVLYYGESAANAADWLGEFNKRRGRTDDATVAYRKALEIQFRLLPQAPLEDRRHTDLQNRFNWLDGLLIETQRTTERRQVARDVVMLYDSLLVDHPGNATLEVARERFFSHLALLSIRSGTLAQRERAAHIEIARLESLATKRGATENQRLALQSTWSALGYVFADASRKDEAIAAHQRALEISEQLAAEYPNDEKYLRLPVQHHVRLADVFYRDNQRQDAEPHNRAIIEFYQAHPKTTDTSGVYPTALFRLAIALVDCGKVEDGDRLITTLFKLEPVSALAKNNLAWILVSTGNAKLSNPARAIELANQAVKVDPKSATYRNTLGVAHYRAGNWQQAIDELTKSAPASREPAIDGFVLAMGHWHLGDKDEARRWYHQAVQWLKKNGKENEELLRFRAEAAELLGEAPHAEP